MSLITSEEEFDRLPQTVQMRQDLQDPARRIAVRAEYKQGLPEFYPDIREQLSLTEVRLEGLFDLLADFQMLHLDIFYAKEFDQLTKQKHFQENEQRRNEALHLLLGPDTLETYRRYQLELPERQFVAYFTRRLDAAIALSPEQKAQFMSVLKAEREQASREREQRLSRRLREVRPARNSEAQLLDANVQANEAGLRDMEAGSRRLLQHAASCLGAPQLAVLTKLEHQKLERQGRWVDSLRTQRASASTAIRVGTPFVMIQAAKEPDNPEGPS